MRYIEHAVYYSMKSVILTTDGACQPNPGFGGWACILKYKEHEKVLSGSDSKTTNNRMELTAVIKGLEALKEPCEVQIITDSKYVSIGITEWITGWKHRNWLTKEKKPVINKDLWMRLDELVKIHQIQWLWVKGHSSNLDNGRCDILARQACYTK